MPKLTNDWRPNETIMAQYKEVNHDREIKYFKHFYITNQYSRGDWDKVYCDWCERQRNRKDTNRTRQYQSQQRNEGDSFYLGVYNELKNQREN